MSAVLLYWELIIVLSLDLLDWAERHWETVLGVVGMLFLLVAMVVVGTVEYGSLGL